jgi:hypothetical protein
MAVHFDLPSEGGGADEAFYRFSIYRDKAPISGFSLARWELIDDVDEMEASISLKPRR